MGTINRPSRSRHTPGRNLVSFRERESPKSPRVKKANEDDDVSFSVLLHIPGMVSKSWLELSRNDPVRLEKNFVSFDSEIRNLALLLIGFHFGLN